MTDTRKLLRELKPFIILGIIFAIVALLVCVGIARADGTQEVYLPLVLNNNRALPTPAPTMGTTPFPYPTPVPVTSCTSTDPYIQELCENGIQK